MTEREQFGAPLIKIPAVSTTLAQMAVRIEFAQSAVDRATTVCADDKTPALQRFGAVSAARIGTANTATLVARSSHQLHGAVGITAEYGLHRYTSKLWALRMPMNLNSPLRPSGGKGSIRRRNRVMGPRLGLAGSGSGKT